MTSLLSALPVGGLRYFESIGSTNDEALAWISSGAPDGALVVAESQTAGRGRFSRRWISRPGASLAFSLAFLPGKQDKSMLNLFSPLGALAVSRALRQCCGLHPQIKWPNDVLLNGRKVCGILAEAAWMGDQLQGIVIGIGVNVASSAITAADELLFPATTIETELNKLINREEFLFLTVKALFDLRSDIGSTVFKMEWENLLAFKNEMVRIEQEGQPSIEGILLGIEPDGSLRLDSNAGSIEFVMVGDVHLRRADP